MTKQENFQELCELLVTVPGKFANGAELTLKTIAETLDITPRAVRMLLEAGVFPDRKSSRIVSLSQKPVFVKSGGKQPILRTGVAGVDPEDNRPIGYGDSMSDADVLEANRKWWRADPDKLIAAHYLPVSLGGLIVALLGINGVEESIRVDVEDKNGNPGKEVRHNFDAYLVSRYNSETGEAVMCMENPTGEAEAATRLFLGHFQRSVSGGPVAYL